MSFFEKADVKRWRRTIHKELRRVRLSPSDGPSYQVAMVLAAVYGFGTNAALLSELTGQSVEYVKTTLKRLRQQRILSGQTLRARWEDKKHGGFAWIIDAMVGAGDLARFVDPKRSAAHKGRHSGPRTPRRPRVTIAKGAIFSPKMVKSNPLYGLVEWESSSDRKGRA